MSTPEEILFTSATRQIYQAAPAPTRAQNSENKDNRLDPAQFQLTTEEKRLLAELKKRDREVRAHEQAHLAVAGQHANGAASFTYQRGPDGRNYAIGGEVSISTSAVPGDPEATLQKADQVRRAALAPANPSSQDRQVAAQASAMAMRARIEISRQQSSVDEAEQTPLEQTRSTEESQRNKIRINEESDKGFPEQLQTGNLSQPDSRASRGIGQYLRFSPDTN